jgi:acetyl esterase/lipase
VLSLVAASPAAADLSPNDYVGMPAGNATAKAWIIVIHGGSWQGGTNFEYGWPASIAQWFNNNGYGTLNIDYRSAPPIDNTFSDVLSAYDWLSAQNQSLYGGKIPLCAWGESAGGHLALMLATARPLNCVISQAGPTDLVKLPNETAGGVSAKNVWATLGTPVFGTDPATLKKWSPDSYCPIATRILMGSSTTDQVVPQQQMADLKAKCTSAQSVLLTGVKSGGYYFTHANITLSAFNQWAADLLNFQPH